MSMVTRRQVIRAGVAAGVVLSAGTAGADPENGTPSSFIDRFLPAQRTKEDIQASRSVKFTKLEFAGSTFWVGIVDWLGDSVPHTWIGIYAPEREGVFHRSLFAESWAASRIEANVDARTGILELRGRADGAQKGQLILACNLKTIGTQHSVEAR